MFNKTLVQKIVEDTNINKIKIQPLSDKAIKSIRGMKTILIKNGFENIIKNNLPNELNIEVISSLEDNIFKKIDAYYISQNTELLEEIFHCVQLWGGVAGRNIYVMGKGFVDNFNLISYKKLANTINKISNLREVVEALQEFKSANKHINVSFITKHTRFMSAKNEIFGQLPIYDSVLSKNLMNEDPNFKSLEHYWEEMINLSKEYNIGVKDLERIIFNYLRG